MVDYDELKLESARTMAEINKEAEDNRIDIKKEFLRKRTFNDRNITNVLQYILHNKAIDKNVLSNLTVRVFKNLVDFRKYVGRYSNRDREWFANAYCSFIKKNEFRGQFNSGQYKCVPSDRLLNQLTKTEITRSNRDLASNLEKRNIIKLFDKECIQSLSLAKAEILQKDIAIDYNRVIHGIGLNIHDSNNEYAIPKLKEKECTANSHILDYFNKTRLRIHSGHDPGEKTYHVQNIKEPHDRNDRCQEHARELIKKNWHKHRMISTDEMKYLKQNWKSQRIRWHNGNRRKPHGHAYCQFEKLPNYQKRQDECKEHYAIAKLLNSEFFISPAITDGKKLKVIEPKIDIRCCSNTCGGGENSINTDVRCVQRCTLEVGTEKIETKLIKEAEIENEKKEKIRKENERKENEKKEKIRLENEKKEKLRLEKEKKEKIRLENEKKEKIRLENEKKEKLRLEKEEENEAKAKTATAKARVATAKAKAAKAKSAIALADKLNKDSEESFIQSIINKIKSLFGQ